HPAFDPTSAKPVGQQPAFDPTSAQPVQEGGGLLDKIGHDIHGAYTGAMMNGFGGLAARKYYEWTGYGIDQLKQQFPGMPDQWYQDKQHALINLTVQNMRNSAAQE